MNKIIPIMLILPLLSIKSTYAMEQDEAFPKLTLGSSNPLAASNPIAQNEEWPGKDAPIIKEAKAIGQGKIKPFNHKSDDNERED